MRVVLLFALLFNIPFCHLEAGTVRTDFIGSGLPESISVSNKGGEAAAIDSSGDTITQKDSTNIRKVYGFVEIGILEAAAFGIGYQIDKTFSVAIKMGSSWTGHSEFVPSLSSGPGLVLSIHRKLLFFNVINLEYSLFYTSNLSDNISTSFPVGGAASLNIGRENVYAKGINFFWAVGLNFNYLKNWSPNTYAPCIKLGLNINI